MSLFRILFIVGCVFSINFFVYSQNLPVVNLQDKLFYLYTDKYDETPLIFGYQSPNVNSQKMICFSSATLDVENNPHKCILGSFYESSELNIDYISLEGNFVKLQLISEDKEPSIFYIEKNKIRME